MKIAFLGLRAVGPSASGGIEKVIEELSTRYVRSGNEVTVFYRARYSQGTVYKGVHLKALPAIYTKHLEAISHTLTAIFYALRDYDIIHINATGPALLSFIPRMLGKSVVVTVHGLDWKREKWGTVAKWILKLGEGASIVFPQRTVVVSRTLKEHYETKYRKKVTYIPNGVALPSLSTSETMNALGLQRDEYILFLSRLVPEKGCHTLIEAFRRLETNKKLAIVGAPSHSQDYADSLRKLAAGDDRIVFLGPLYDEDKEVAYRNAYFFVLPSTIEGMALVLLEAMSYGKCCLCSDIDENLEVISRSDSRARRMEQQRLLLDGEISAADQTFGVTFRTGDARDLTQKMEALLRNSELVEKLGQRARSYVAVEYDWDRIAQDYLALYRDLVQTRTAKA